VREEIVNGPIGERIEKKRIRGWASFEKMAQKAY
jgi:hypothetical protein